MIFILQTQADIGLLVLPEVKLLVENLTGTLFYIQVSNDATFGDLKREIETQQKLPYNRLILILDANETHLMNKEEEGCPMVDYRVKDGSHIYMFLNPFVEVDDSSNH